MRFLIDTHIFLWFLEDNSGLSKKSRKIMENSTNMIFISTASFWEVTIKVSLKKLVLDIPLDKLFEEAKRLDFSTLNIHSNHLICLQTIPFLHKDPFDRLLIAQAKSEEMSLLSADNVFQKYEVDLIHN